ncbi:MAG: hypothetical protein M3P06_02995 [Acidobacteriota bacterium]|nr:hypothetical protein [Acidobacteriota bacterium]
MWCLKGRGTDNYCTGLQRDRFKHGSAVATIASAASVHRLWGRRGAFAAIVSDVQGNTERRDALASEVDARAQSLQEMKRDLLIRGAVIGQTTNAIDKCLSLAFWSSHNYSTTSTRPASIFTAHLDPL